MNTSSTDLFRTPQVLKKHLRGALAFPITPYASDGSVDLDAVRQNVSWLPDTGITAIVSPSGTGELFGLSQEESSAVVSETVRAVDGRIPVIASVGFGPAAARQMAEHAERVGADGILVLPPYYGQPDAHGLFHYYAEVADATSLGVIPYARDSAAFTPELVERMAVELPNLVAFKDGRGDVRLFQRIREHVIERVGEDRLDWLAGVGDDLVAPYFASGAVGFTSSLACFWPEASVELYRLASAGDFAALRKYHGRNVRPFYELRQRGRGFEVSVMKAAMEILGHRAGPPRPPLGRLSEHDLTDLRQLIENLGIPTARVRMNSAQVIGG